MWVCKNCGKEVMLYESFSEVGQMHKIDKNGDITDTTILDYRNKHQCFECLDCPNYSYKLEEIARWVEEEEQCGDVNIVVEK